MSRFKVEFTLKQHTPIIHFQADQKGATLRATELKPKFDKFLKEYAFKGSIPKEFLIDKSKDALNYKVLIEPNYTEKEDIPKRDPLFFGNMGDDENKKYFKQYDKNFKITFFSFKKEILNKIVEYFESFLANTNFGTRQSKGYGSFYIANKNFDKSLVKADRVFEFKTSNWKEDIKLFYQFLRQGINLKDRNKKTIFYSKPLIYLYFKQKGIDWEKSAIKKFLNGERVDPNKHKIVRDLFGLSSSQFWMSYRKTISKEHSLKNDKSDKKKTEEKIERFKSPVTFKVIGNKVYFWVDENSKKLLEKLFKQPFEIDINKRTCCTLNFPDRSDFNIDDFFDFMLNADLNKIVQKQFQINKNYYDLQRILREIKN